jgi:hypothetical protein
LCVSGGLSTSLYGAEEHKEAEWHTTLQNNDPIGLRQRL